MACYNLTIFLYTSNKTYLNLKLKLKLNLKLIKIFFGYFFKNVMINGVQTDGHTERVFLLFKYS